MAIILAGRESRRHSVIALRALSMGRPWSTNMKSFGLAFLMTGKSVQRAGSWIYLKWYCWSYQLALLFIVEVVQLVLYEVPHCLLETWI